MSYLHESIDLYLIYYKGRIVYIDELGNVVISAEQFTPTHRALLYSKICTANQLKRLKFLFGEDLECFKLEAIKEASQVDYNEWFGTLRDTMLSMGYEIQDSDSNVMQLFSSGLTPDEAVSLLERELQ